MSLIFILFLILVIIFIIHPTYIKNMYNSFLGRLIIVIIVLYFAVNYIILGLLLAILFIIYSNLVNKEGLENLTYTTNIEEKEKKVEKRDPSIDLETIKNSLQSKPSSTLPIITPESSEDVVGTTKENFKSMFQSF